MNNPVLIELEKYVKDCGATREEFSPLKINRYIFRLLKRARIEDMSLPEREEYISNLNKRVIDNVSTFLLKSGENGDSLFFKRVCTSIVANICAVFFIAALAINLNDHNRNRQEHTSSTMLEQANINMLSATTKKHWQTLTLVILFYILNLILNFDS